MGLTSRYQIRGDREDGSALSPELCIGTLLTLRTGQKRVRFPTDADTGRDGAPVFVGRL